MYAFLPGIYIYIYISSRIAGLLHVCLLSFSRYCRTVFQRGCFSLPFSLAVYLLLYIHNNTGKCHKKKKFRYSVGM